MTPTGSRPSEPPLPGIAAAILQAAAEARIGLVVTVADGTDWRREFVSEAAAAALGYSREEMLALPANAYFRPEALAAVQRWRESLRKGEDVPRVIETELAHRSGAALPVRLAASETTLDGLRASVDFFFVTAEQQATERALRQSEQRFRQLVETAPDAVVVLDGEGLVYCNPAHLKLVGYESFDQLAETPSSARLHPDDVAVAFERIRRTKAGERLPPGELRLARSDGRFVPVEVVEMRVEWDGKPAVLSFLRELSQRRQLQSELVQTDRTTAIGTLAAGVAHEINNPLAYVLLNLQYLLRELPRLHGDPARLQQLLDRLGEARHGVERVSTIVRDLRAFSGTAEEEERGAVDMRLVLGSAIKVAKNQIEQRGRLVEELDDDIPAVHANAARLEQVFLNLLVNAAQALPTGQKERHTVTVSLGVDDNGSVVAQVGDTGAGIAPGLLDRVFDPFFTTKPVGIGTGLGLPICHSIITALGGEIGVTSGLGKGTTFRVVLPAYRETDAPPRRSLTPPAMVPHEHRPRVLVVDDELPVASMLGRVLGDEYDVQLTTTGREALELLLVEPSFDVVLCDLLMPGMSGMDLYRQLQRQRPGSEERLVFMTGGAFTPRASEFLATVSNPRIEKPFDLHKMRHLVRRLCEKPGDS